MDNSLPVASPNEIEHLYKQINNINFHYVVSGKGPVVVLLHGMAGTWYTWRHIIPSLAHHYTLIVPDLRGFGDSEKPGTDYIKKTLAKDIHGLLGALGHASFLIAGHDFGGSIAYALAAAYPKSVRKLAVFESLLALPTNEVTVPAWFVTFFQTPDMPELLLQGHEREFLKLLMNQATINKSAVSEKDLDEYARTFVLPGAVRAAAELYRAIPADIEDNREYSKQKLQMPILVFGADNGMKDKPLQSFQAVGAHVTGGIVPDCGHFVPEEQPEFVVEKLLSFFGEESVI